MIVSFRRAVNGQFDKLHDDVAATLTVPALGHATEQPIRLGTLSLAGPVVERMSCLYSGLGYAIIYISDM